MLTEEQSVRESISQHYRDSPLKAETSVLCFFRPRYRYALTIVFIMSGKKTNGVEGGHLKVHHCSHITTQTHEGLNPVSAFHMATFGL